MANLAGEVMIKVSPIPGSLLGVKEEVAAHFVNCHGEIEVFAVMIWDSMFVMDINYC